MLNQKFAKNSEREGMSQHGFYTEEVHYLEKGWHFQPEWLPPKAEKSIFELFGWKEGKTMHFRDAGTL